jgi:hypothetical protein
MCPQNEHGPGWQLRMLSAEEVADVERLISERACGREEAIARLEKKPAARTPCPNQLSNRCRKKIEPDRCGCGRGEIMETMEYFSRPETPAPGSPVGELMVRVLAKNPGMGFEEARAVADTLLDKAAGSRVYRLPRVLSPEERAEQKERMRARFNPLLKAA